jgi:hypothetical protein
MDGLDRGPRKEIDNAASEAGCILSVMFDLSIKVHKDLTPTHCVCTALRCF